MEQKAEKEGCIMRYIYMTADPSPRQNYRRAIAQAGRICCIGEDKERCEALLLPGGGDVEPWRYGAEAVDCRAAEPVRDEEELRLIEEFLCAGKPILGICRGLQILNIYFGGTLLQNVKGHSAVEGRDSLHPSRIAPSPLRRLYGDTLRINSAHHQAVDRLGSGLRAVQWAPDGVIEAVVHEALPVWAVQWHPERLETEGQRLLRSFLSQER